MGFDYTIGFELLTMDLYTIGFELPLWLVLYTIVLTATMFVVAPYSYATVCVLDHIGNSD